MVLHPTQLPLRTEVFRFHAKAKANFRKSDTMPLKRAEMLTTMKRKNLILVAAGLLAAVGLWVGRTYWSAEPSEESMAGVTSTSSEHAPTSAQSSRTGGPNRQQGAVTGRMVNPPNRHAPPNPTQKFADFTPEERVEFARKGHGPGG
jgi:hypothetical protein